MCPFDYTAVAVSGRLARKPVNHTSWVALATPTDRPKSVRNRCLIELFCGVVCVVTCPFDISVGVGAFVIGLGQISSFLSSNNVQHAPCEKKPCKCKNGYYGDLCQDRDCTLTSWTAWSRCTPCPGKCEWDACPKSVRTDEYRSRQRGVKIHNAGAGRCEGERRQSAYCGYCKMTCFLNYLPTGNMSPTRCAQYKFVRDYQEPRK